MRHARGGRSGAGAKPYARPAGRSRFPHGGQTQQGNRVYVGNLAYSVSWQDLKDHFKPIGHVVYAEVFSDGPGRSKGCGVVEFGSRAEAQRAIEELTDSELRGRAIFVREDREQNTFNAAPGAGPRGPQAGETLGRQVHVGNLDFAVGWQDLKDLFRGAGNVVRADILGDHEGLSKGQGTVLYGTADDAQNAIRMYNGFQHNGRALSVKIDKLDSSAYREFGAAERAPATAVASGMRGGGGGGGGHSVGGGVGGGGGGSR